MPERGITAAGDPLPEQGHHNAQTFNTKRAHGMIPADLKRITTGCRPIGRPPDLGSGECRFESYHPDAGSKEFAFRWHHAHLVCLTSRSPLMPAAGVPSGLARVRRYPTATGAIPDTPT